MTDLVTPTSEKTDRTRRPAPARASTGRPRHSRAARRNLAAAGAFLTPFVLLLLVFQYVPLFVLARDSVYQYSLFNPDARVFVGFDNFVTAFTDPTTVQSMLVTLIFVVGMVVVVVPTSFLLAVYLNGRLPARALIRTMIFLPVVTSSVVVATLFLFMLAQQGLVNGALQSIGLGPIPFLTDPAFALPAIILMSVWQQVGLAAVLFLGGLQGIPEEVQEASVVDGAGPVRRLVSITIPLVSRTTLLVVIVMTVFALQAFAPAMLMTGGGPVGSTNLIIFHIYRTAFNLQQPGLASAISIIVLLFALAISLIQMRLLRTRWNY
ncbi:carbohydrate ABC transporter permease [Agromyces aerolatus]|uniref:carbohydrate ABC transporter permease n=1 Tax=Agromyces sp. LY-1074 TaxID=3074080 RepID=UPI00285A0FC4|nr:MULTISPECIES: sugar ABC transporter permease [unclassified Agromyces]MDR5700442.1 sugar ABC transporter permease [Agromyces sp. LY-1074]MDR5706963.1 sugar ABC transporter permease [Agromyces sp. LY-1358]